MSISRINHTQVSNEFIEEHMKELSGGATKVFLAISRKTIGWHKETDSISIAQIMSITGLSNRGVINAVTELEKKELINVSRQKSARDYNYTNKYTIAYEESSRGCEIISQGYEESSLIGSEKSSQTKEIYKETITKERAESKKDKDKKDRSSSTNNFLSSFNIFWSMYDKKVNMKKCLDLWKKINPTLYDTIYKHTKAYVSSTPDKSWRKDPERYLKHECWNNEIIRKKEQGIEYPEL